MNPSAKVYLRLELWSEYIIRNKGDGHAWPRCVSWARELPPSGYRDSIPIPVTYDEYNEIDKKIRSLPDVLIKVIYAEWCTIGSRKQKANDVKTSPATYNKRLARAYTELDQVLV